MYVQCTANRPYLNHPFSSDHPFNPKPHPKTEYVESGHQQAPGSQATPSPQFAFCGTFSEKDNISASRWIKRLEFELKPFQDEHGVVPVRKFISSIDLLALR